jgi:S1-C subfamily serine protease
MKRSYFLWAACVVAGWLVGRGMTADDSLTLGANHAHAAPGDFWNDQSDAPVELTAEERTNVSVYEHSNPSVVNINTKSTLVDNFFMLQRQAEGSGSGAVLDKMGHIITNMHVVDDADDIQITLASNKTYPAILIGQDREQDIAVLRIDAPAEELTPIATGRSDNLRVGQRVYVLGNPFGWDGTMTTGIISSLNRDLPSREPGRVMQSLIQTDAAMNPGNSGGPLLDSGSRMIGMCVAIATKTGQNSGVGFAIPIDRIKRIVPELIENGRIVKADIGISHVMETDSGLVIARVTPDGPADKAGLEGFRRVVQRRREGPVVYETETIDRSHADRILAVDGEAMRSGVQFRDKIWQYRPGDVVKVTIQRDGRQMDVPVTLGSN